MVVAVRKWTVLKANLPAREKLNTKRYQIRAEAIRFRLGVR